MKNLLMIALLFITSSFAKGQDIDLTYYPSQSRDVDIERYNRGKQVLSISYQKIKAGNKKINHVDYWNLSVGLALMGERKEMIFQLLKKCKAESPYSFCSISNYHIDDKDGKLSEVLFYQLLGQKYMDLLADCEDHEEPESSRVSTTKEGLDLSNLNEPLIDDLIRLLEKDQRFRDADADYEKQATLDEEIQNELRQIFDIYGYPGKSMVSARFMNYACLMLIHEDELGYQEKYFPKVIEALKKGEVDKSVVRMLIDRIHWKKTKKQIFGSQFGVPFDTDEVIDNVKAKYNLNF